MRLFIAQLLGEVCTCLETQFFVRIFVRIFKMLLNQEHHDSSGKVPFSQKSREDLLRNQKLQHVSFSNWACEDFREDFQDAIESGP